MLVLYGCGGDENNGNGDGNPNLAASRTQVTRNTLDVVDRVLEIVIGDEASVTQGQHRADGGAVTRQEPVRITIPCDRGEVSFRGEIDNGASENRFTIDGIVTFTNCDGIAGRLGLDSAGTVRGNQITIALTLEGDLTAEGCSLTFADFSAATTANTQGRLTSPVLVNGVLRATCDDDRMVCTPANVDIADREAFEDSCREA
jgi:hypothetical protein